MTLRGFHLPLRRCSLQLARSASNYFSLLYILVAHMAVLAGVATQR